MIHWPRWLVDAVTAVVVGGAIGWLLEPLVPLIGGPVKWPGCLVFLGAMDGGMVMLYRLAARNRQLGRTPRLGYMSLLMITFAAFAFLSCSDTKAIFGINAAIGAILGWFFFPGDDAQGQSTSDEAPD